MIYSDLSDRNLIKQLERNLYDAKSYNFATAYFDFKLLFEYFDNLKRAIEKGLKVRFLISDAVNEKEFKKIKSAIDKDRITFLNLMKADVDKEDAHELIEWISSGDIAFRVISKIGKGIVHYKLGYMDKEDGSVFEWQGSANHTFNGFLVNQEHITFDNKEDSDVKKLFNDAWNGHIENTIVQEADDVIEAELLSDSEIDVNAEEKLLLKFEKIITILDGKFKYLTRVKEGAYWAPPSINISVENGYEENPIGINKLATLRWADEKKVYIPQFARNLLEQNISVIQDKIKLGNEIINNFEEIKKTEEYNKFASPINELKRKPYEQQYKQAYFAYMMKKSMNFSVPGTGKTMVSLTAFKSLQKNNGVNTILVIGPTSSHATWEEEFEVTIGRKPKVFNLSSSNMSPDDKEREIRFNAHNYDLIIGHFSSATKYHGAFVDTIDDTFFVVIDEAHYVKNESGIWGSAITKVGRKSKYLLLLTGTPAPNGIKDIYNLVEMAFGRAFLNYLKTSSNQEEIISSIHLRITFEDLQMKYEQIDSIVEYHLSASAKERIDKVNKSLFSSSINPLEALIKRMQIASSEKLLSGDMFDENDSNKLSRMLEIINPEKNYVIWANTINSIKSIEAVLKRKYAKTPIYSYYGEKQSGERNSIIESYKKGGGILVATPHTLAEAVSLHKITDETIYFEYNYNLIHWEQSRNRTFRYGMENDMVYHILKADNDPVEDAILNRLQTKTDFQLSLVESNEDDIYVALGEIREFIERTSY